MIILEAVWKSNSLFKNGSAQLLFSNTYFLVRFAAVVLILNMSHILNLLRAQKRGLNTNAQNPEHQWFTCFMEFISKQLERTNFLDRSEKLSAGVK